MRRWILFFLLTVLAAVAMAGCPFTSAQTRMLYYTSPHFGPSRLYVMNLDGRYRTELWQTDDAIGGVSATSDGSCILVNSVANLEQGSLIVLNSEGKATTVVQDGWCIDRPMFTSDGTRVVFGILAAPDFHYALQSVKVDGSDLRTLADGQTIPFLNNVSPVGSQVVFVMNVAGNDEICTVDAAGGEPVNLTNNPAYDHSPVYSPDGSRIAFVSDRDGNFEIYVMNADGTCPVNLSNSSAEEECPVFSPDGTKVAYLSCAAEDCYSLCVVSVDGTGRKTLADCRWGQPVWSPDCSRIAFVSNRDGNDDIWVVDVNDGVSRNLTQNEDPDGCPVWTLDGNRVLFRRGGILYSILQDGTNLKDLTNGSGGSFGQFIEAP